MGASNGCSTRPAIEVLGVLVGKRELELSIPRLLPDS